MSEELQTMSISEDQLTVTKDKFSDMITLLGLSGDIKANVDRKLIRLDINTSDPGRLIGKNGKTLNALQHLLNGILLNRNRTFPKVLINVNGDQDDSTEAEATSDQVEQDYSGIRQRAMDAIKEVKRWGEEVTITSLKEEEVDQIREVLNEEPEIEIEEDLKSGRTGENKIIIRLKNADAD